MVDCISVCDTLYPNLPGMNPVSDRLVPVVLVTHLCSASIFHYLNNGQIPGVYVKRWEEAIVMS